MKGEGEVGNSGYTIGCCDSCQTRKMIDHVLTKEQNFHHTITIYYLLNKTEYQY